MSDCSSGQSQAGMCQNSWSVLSVLGAVKNAALLPTHLTSVGSYSSALSVNGKCMEFPHLKVLEDFKKRPFIFTYLVDRDISVLHNKLHCYENYLLRSVDI